MSLVSYTAIQQNMFLLCKCPVCGHTKNYTVTPKEYDLWIKAVHPKKLSQKLSSADLSLLGSKGCEFCNQHR